MRNLSQLVRNLSQLVILCVFLSFLSMPLMAGDGVPPSQEGVCDGLKNEAGITKGLYGLCVAYCEAEAHSEQVLETYNSRRTGSDPAMPCLEVDPPEEVDCPCWGTDRLANASLLAEPNYCFNIFESAVPTYSTAVYGENAVSFVNATENSSSYCSYDGPDGFSLESTTPEERVICQAEFEILVATDFPFCY